MRRPPPSPQRDCLPRQTQRHDRKGRGGDPRRWTGHCQGKAGEESCKEGHRGTLRGRARSARDAPCRCMLALGLQRRPPGLQSLWPHQSTAVRLCACNAPVSVRADTLKFTLQGSIAAAAQAPRAHPATHPRATRKRRQRPRAEVPTPTSGMWASSCTALRFPPALGLFDSEFRLLLGSASRLRLELRLELADAEAGWDPSISPIDGNQWWAMAKLCIGSFFLPCIFFT